MRIAANAIDAFFTAFLLRCVREFLPPQPSEPLGRLEDATTYFHIGLVLTKVKV
jgi:hypothetical protein